MTRKKGSNKEPKTPQLDLWDTELESPWEDFKVAKEYARSLQLKGPDDWKEFVSTGEAGDARIPGNPDIVYRNHGWKGWNDWLGISEPEETGKPSLSELFTGKEKDSLWSNDERSKWLNFLEARQIVRDYGFEYEEEWDLFVRGKFPGRDPLPDNIPSNPDQVYRFLGWKGWKDWLIHPEMQIDYTGFYRARDFVRSNRIPDMESWRSFLQNESGLIEEYHMILPARPHLEYRDDGWQSWEDWLGSEIPYQDFRATRNFVRSLGLINREQWIEFCDGRLAHKPVRKENIFAYPEIAFRNDGWKDWGDWLGTGMEKKGNVTPSATAEISIECKCRGRLKDCPVCDGKGFYNVRID